MAQHDYTIANQGFPAFRSDLNDALAAIVSNNSGATEPSTMFAHQIWVDTAANPSILKIRNADNDAWITIGTINQTGDTFTLTSAVSATTLNTSGAVVFNDAGADVDFRVEGDTDANLLFVDAGNDRVGMGTSSPRSQLTLTSSSGGVFTLENSSSAPVANDYFGRIQFYSNDVSGASSGIKASIDALVTSSQAATDIVFSNCATASTALTERARLDSSGNLLVNSTSANSQSTGVSVGGVLLQVKGDIVPAIDAGNNGHSDLGDPAYRYEDAYVRDGVTIGSDGNDKQDIEELTEAEQRVAVACKGLLRKWRWKDAVEKKGDDARIHFGIIAQDLKAAFEAEGLDAGRYAMFIHSEWWETQTDVPAVEAQEAVYETQTDEEGNEVQVLVSEAVEAKEAYTRTDTYETEEEAPEGAVRKERMGIRYNELLAFIIAAI